MRQAFHGGAKTIIACRVGNGGTQATISLNDSEGETAVTLTALYPGEKDFTITISIYTNCIKFKGFYL